MESVFLWVLGRSLSASLIILAAVLLRALLKKAPKGMRMALWALVFLRLVCPVTVESALSLVPSAKPLDPAPLYSDAPAVSTGIAAVDAAVNPVIGASLAPDPAASADPAQIWAFIGSVIWLCGIAVMLALALLSYLRLRRRVRGAAETEAGVFVCGSVDFPFILGLFRPKIYLPAGMTETQRVCVLAHERAHLARRDQITKLLGFLTLSVYWFAPLVWLSYVLLCRDIELCCDERVIRGLGAGARKDYSRALLELSAPRAAVSACPLAFGEVGVKARIKNVLGYKKPAVLLIAAAVLVCCAAALLFLTDPKPSGTDGETPNPFGAYYRTDAVLYQAGYYDFTYRDGDEPQFELTPDGGLHVFNDAPLTWDTYGRFEEASLTGAELDALFSIPGPGSADAAELLRGSAGVWSLRSGSMLYYLFAQPDGTVCLAVAYTDSGAARWLFRLARENSPVPADTVPAGAAGLKEGCWLMQLGPNLGAQYYAVFSENGALSLVGVTGSIYKASSWSYTASTDETGPRLTANGAEYVWDGEKYVSAGVFNMMDGPGHYVLERTEGTPEDTPLGLAVCSGALDAAVSATLRQERPDAASEAHLVLGAVSSYDGFRAWVLPCCADASGNIVFEEPCIVTLAQDGSGALTASGLEYGGAVAGDLPPDGPWPEGGELAAMQSALRERLGDFTEDAAG